MIRLIFADVHANLPAMEAVLSSVGHFDEAWFLGDIIGWGPYPSECTSLLMELGAKCVIGNHDAEVCIEREENFYWNKWTYSKLTEEQKKFITAMPKSVTIDDTFIIHRPDGTGYFYPSKTKAEDVSRAFSGINEKRFFFAHCHHRMDFVSEGREYHCIRAVGQMRDRDPRAGYTVEENGVLRHYRVEYDIDKLLFGLDRVGLEEIFLKRWKNFASTAYDKDWSRE